MTETEKEWHDRMHREVVTTPDPDKSKKEILEAHSLKLAEWIENNPPPTKVLRDLFIVKIEPARTEPTPMMEEICSSCVRKDHPMPMVRCKNFGGFNNFMWLTKFGVPYKCMSYTKPVKSHRHVSGPDKVRRFF